MSIIGLVLGLKGQDTSADDRWTVVAVVWAASIGFGLGTVFDQKQPTRRLVLYWAGTLALIGPFFGLLLGAGLQPYASTAQEVFHGVIGAVTGSLFGLLIGTVQLRRFRAGVTGTGNP